MSEEKRVLTGTVKWFDCRRGYGFVTVDDTDYFMHYSSINMPDRKKYLDTNDTVEFEPEKSEKGLIATNVTPVLTLGMIRKALKKEGLYVMTFQNAYGNEVYRVVDENNFIQSPEQGMYFNELAKYAELVSQELSNRERYRTDKKKEIIRL